MSAERKRRLLSACALAAGLLFAGCDGLFDVENPNNVKGEDLTRPEAASAVVNGAFGTVARGLAASLGVYSPVTDEITYIGSRDAWNQLNIGELNDPQNEFSNVAFPFVAQGRWMADEAIRVVESFQEEGTLRDPRLLARAYMYGAIAYMNIADTWEDFALSDRGEAAPPVGPENMGGLYDTAVDYLTKGLAIASAVNDLDLRLTMTALRSRAHHAKAVWTLLNPPSGTPADPLVSSEAAVQDALAFFALGPDPDWRYAITLSGDDMVPGGEITLGHNMNDRAELQFGPAYVSTDPEDPAAITGITFMDLIDDIPDPHVSAEIQAFRDAFIYTTETVVSAREMHLILAEDALANGRTGDAVAQINAVRALDEVTAYDPGVHPETPLEMLRHERRSSLFLMNRRLSDMYRFGITAPAWDPSADAVVAPGTFFPIPQVERLANCHIAGTC
ncbi:MAG TPA: hypothetical protein VF188_01615 [Longimicrobiales bacterium]